MALATFDETDDLIAQIRDTLEFMSEFGFYQQRFDSVGLAPADIDSLETFRELPMMKPKDIAADIESNPPFGSLIPEGESVARSHFTPSPHMDRKMPVPYTRSDLELLAEGTAEIYRDMGVTQDDVVLNTGSLAPYPAGWICSMAVEEIGATHLPMGPGDTEEKIDTIARYDVTTIYGFPSFLEQIADTASPDDLESVKRLLATGEPFTAISGYRGRVIEAYGGDVVATDAYGLSEFGGGLVAYESESMDGMHVPSDLVLVEVIDLESGDLVDRGEKGELVLTSLSPHSHPVLRMRTGDLTVFDKSRSEYGEYKLPEGIFGRVDDMRKVKGVKVYPSEVQMFLAGVEGADARNVQIVVTRPQGATDLLTVRLGGDPDSLDLDALADDLSLVMGIRVDDLEVSDDIELGDEPVIVVEDP